MLDRGISFVRVKSKTDSQMKVCVALLDQTRRLNKLEALTLWHRVMLKSVRGDGPDLTARQFVILTTIYLIDRIHTVRSLSAELCVSKAVVTRALDTLGRNEFVRRSPDPRDKRSIIIQRTAHGASYLREFGDIICADSTLKKTQVAA